MPPHYSGSALAGFELLACLGSGAQGTVYLACPWQANPYRRWATRRWLRACLAGGALTAPRAARWQLAALKLAHPSATAALHAEHSYLIAGGATHPHLISLYCRRYSSPNGLLQSERVCAEAMPANPAGRRPYAQDAHSAQTGSVLPPRHLDAACAQATGLVSDFGLSRLAGQPRLYLALAYEAGLSLERLLGQWRQAPSLRWTLALIEQTAAALAHLHGRGIIHHDLRPANLIVRRGPTHLPHVVLLDLGAAETPARPRRQAIYGAPHYLPPERLSAAPEPASPQVDIYSLGRLLALLTATTTRSAPLSALIAAATAPAIATRTAALPDMSAFRARLRALPEAKGTR